MTPPDSRPRHALFARLCLLALAAPLLGWLGVRGFVGAHGFDTPDVTPRFSAQALFSGSWQRQMSEHFSHIFFGRTEALFLKNGLHDAATLGRDRAGAAGTVVQGRAGVLFERPYLDVALNGKPLPIEKPRTAADTAAALRTFRSALAAFRPSDTPPVAFVLAPSKAETCREWIPRRFLRFAKRQASPDPEPYRTWKRLLDDSGIPFASPDDLAPMRAFAGGADVPRDIPSGSPGPEKLALFPYSGTHWTVAAASLAAAAALERAAPRLPRPELAAVSFQRHVPDDPRDRDLAGLLNIPVRYRHRPDLYAHAVFSAPRTAPSSSRPRIAILGDSFGEQLREALIRSGVCTPENAVLHANELPSARAFRELAAGADVILFAYSAPSLSSSRACRTLQDLANALVPNVRVGRHYALGRSPYILKGAWGEEDGGRVATIAPGKEGVLELFSNTPLPVGATVSVQQADPDAPPLKIPLPPPERPADGETAAAFRHAVRVACPENARAPLRLTSFRVQ